MSFSVVENSALLGKPRTVTGGASGNDPMDDVRSTLTQLTARAQRIGLENVDSRVVRNGRSLYDLSAKAAEEARQRAKRAGGDGSTYGAAQASEELFMAKQLGFDVQEQQRLLHHIQKNEAQLAADLCSNETTAVGGLGAYYSPGEASGEGRGEVDTIVARLKNEILLQTQCTVHRREKERAQEQEYTVFRAAWNSYYLSLADHLESLSMTRGPESKNLNTTTTRPSNGGARMRSTGSVADFLASDSPAALEANLKAAGFAQMVRSVPPSQWCTHFAAYATEQSSPTSEDTAMLWATAELLLEPVFRAGSAATVMTYVGSSRYVMERKSFSRLLSTTMRIDPTRFEEVASMSASRVLEVLARSSSASNPWMHVFLAMRCGRYDVAVLAAERIGSAAVSAALEAYTKAHAAQLHTIPSAGADVRELYAEAETRDDVYRQAVLFLLLVGQTGESADVVHRTMLSLCRQVASSIEDALWLRLACVRTVEESAKANNIQSLAYLQKALLEDLQDLIVIAHGNVPRLACFLMHALLPCTGLRLLLEQEATYVDGLHLVLCLNAGDMLLCSAQETPIDLARHLMRYCTLVLMDLDRRVQGSVVAGTSVFHYFHKTGLEDSFVDFCQSEAVCGRLFGHAGTGYAIGGHNAALLVAQPPSPELMKAMTAVAELAATRNNACTAVHVFLVLANAAYTTQKESVMYSALSRALQVISPAMAQGFHLPPHSTAAASIFMQAAQLRHWIRHIRTMSSTSVDELSTMDIQSFELLCVLADVFASEAQGNLEHALSVFFTLPFVPQSMVEDLDVCVERYTSRSSANLLTGVAAIIPIVFRAAMALLNLYSSEADDASQEKRYQLTQRMKVVAEWVKRCSRAVHTYRECPPEVLELESQYLK